MLLYMITWPFYSYIGCFCYAIVHIRSYVCNMYITVTINKHLVPMPEQATIEDKGSPQIEKEITCLICGDFFTNPMTLSCSHTFCKQCIKNNLKKNKTKNIACCPICCEVILQDDIESIPINFNVKKLVEVFKNEAEKKCGNCETEGSFFVWCIECNNLYCQNCNEIHTKWKDFKSHRVVDLIQSSSDICNTHFKPIDFYCKTCNSVICQECTLQIHPFETHDIDFINTVATKRRENIKQATASLEQLLKQVRSKAKMLEDHENLVDRNSKVNIEQIKSSFQQLHNILIRNEEEVLKNIDLNELLLKQMVATQKKNVTLLEIQLEGCKGFTENIMTANKTQQMLLHHHWILRRVHHLAEQVTNINFDLQSHKHITASFSVKSDEFISPLCYTEGVLRLPHCSIHVCTPLVKPKQVKLIITLKDILGYPTVYQSDNIKIYSNMEVDFLQDVKVKEQLEGVYHIYYSVKRKMNHLILVYLGDTLINHESIEVPINARDYTNINKKEVKKIKNGLPETPLKFPYSLAKGPSNQLIFGDDSTSKLIVFSDQLQYSHCIGKRGKQDGEFQSITGIAVYNNEHVYVSDSDLNCIQKFKLDGKFVYKFGSYGSKNGQFRSPHGLLVCDSKLFVCDRQNHRIQIFIRENWCSTFGREGTEPGSFKEPIDLSLNNNEDQIFVTDNKNHRIQVFTLDGLFVRVFGDSKGIPSSLQKNPVGIFITSDGYVLVTYYRTGCIMIFDEDETFVSAVEGNYQGKVKFNHPCGIVMMDNGEIIIACNLSNGLVVL